MSPLTQTPLPNRPLIGYGGQRGVVLLIALIVLVALTLAGIALIRSVDTTNLVAGNMSLHQSAIHAGERSTELAIDWLHANNSATLYGSAAGYSAVRQDPAVNATTTTVDSWEAFWTATLAGQAVTGTTDAAGNTVAYVIHRLCDGAGAPQTVNCSRPPPDPEKVEHVAGRANPLATSKQVYYRITTRITGPRNTVAYLQTIVAL